MDAELACIRSQREILIAAERQRVRTAAAPNRAPEQTVAVPSEGEPAAKQALPPARAATYLRYHPETAYKFDAEYGKGKARQILKTYGAAKGPIPASEPAQQPAFPRAADVTALLRDPRYGPAFDRKYGKGMAVKILGGGVTVASSAP